MKHQFQLAALLGATLGLLAPSWAQPRPIRPTAPIGGPAISTDLLRKMAIRQAFSANIAVKSPSILAARGLLGTAKLNQLVSVRGFYYDGSIPMIVDDIERVNCDTLLPTQTYVPLASRVAGLQSGDEVTISGRLIAPNAVAGLALDDEESVLQLEVPVAQAVQKVGRANTMLRLNPNFIVRIPDIRLKLAPRKYAVLLIGGGNAANNHLRYWNDLRTMYAILKSRGYDAKNITVIYADGVGKSATVPINYSASKANVRAAFKALGDKMTTQDELYVMINDHGGGFLSQAVSSYTPGLYGGILDTSNSIGQGWSEAAYNMDLNSDGDKNDTVHFHNTVSLWGELMTDDEFGAALDQVTRVKTTMIQMKQCFSGGFVQRLNRANRVVMSSCKPTELSWGHSSGNYGSFTYFYFSALTGQTPDGLKIGASSTVNANTNGDGMVSLAEAWNYAKANNPKPEVAVYADTASMPASVTMPGAGHGALGGSVTP